MPAAGPRMRVAASPRGLRAYAENLHADDCGRLAPRPGCDRMTATAAPSSATAAPDAPPRSHAVPAASPGPWPPLAAFGAALPVTRPRFDAAPAGSEMGLVAAVFVAVRLIGIVLGPLIGWGTVRTRTRLGRY